MKTESTTRAKLKVKKLEIHVFPNKTSSGKSFSLSLVKAVLFVLCIVAAVAGYLMFSPVSILDNITSGNITALHRQNSSIRKELKTIRASVDESILKAEETRALRDSTLRKSGLGFALEPSVDYEQTIESRKSLMEMESTFKKLLTALEKDSALAAKIPVLHPLKNGHAIKKRFEMVYDPFTDSELPHRGIDYVAVEGDTVYATGAGFVSEIRSHRGFGLSMKIEHAKSVRTFYAHLGKALVPPESLVCRGQPIAIIGESGRETSVGLHYEIRVKGNPINPELFFITK